MTRRYGRLCGAMFTVCLLVASGVACRPLPADIRKSDVSPPVRIPIGPVPGIGDTTTAVANPFGADRAASGEGRRLFLRFNCAGCHGDHGGGGMGPSLRDSDWIYGSGDIQIFGPTASTLFDRPMPTTRR